MTDTVEQWQSKAELHYRITVVSFGLLIALLILGQFVHGFSLTKLGMQLIPLLIFIPGLIAKVNYRTYSWLCFVLLAYFTAYVVELGSPLRHWTDGIGVTLTVVMFVSAMMASRYVQRWQVALREAQV
ncbi:DUF2069 domain-containing protein [Halioxenophilus aromaticivorans]|uniref:DUF2069 domain-containing protein n=1 Tax=Halioxenophilus aromaticivorans TaxID=1306992 RepID=A0AAV3TZU3_9ALTE